MWFLAFEVKLSYERLEPITSLENNPLLWLFSDIHKHIVAAALADSALFLNSVLSKFNFLVSELLHPFVASGWFETSQNSA